MTMTRVEKIILGTTLVAAMAAYSFFPWATASREIVRFNSPDEAANYFFAMRLVNTQSISVVEPLNGLANNLIHPRATRVVNGAIVPAGFLGEPLIYGVFGLAFSRAILPFITPIFTVLALLALYACWRRLFETRVAQIATILLAIHPAVWYYASRGFYHNLLFFNLLIFTCWGYWRWRESEWSLGWLVFWIFALAAALFVRTSEIFWVLPIAVITLIRDRRSLRLAHLYTGVFTAGLLIIISLWLAIIIYGQVWPPGYQISGASSTVFAKLPSIIRMPLWAILPFGFSPFSIISNFWRYGIILFLPIWLLVAGGFLLNRGQSLQHPYFIMSSIATLWLAVYYGSWDISDTVGATGLTVGSSYVRYWIPLYTVWLPYAAEAILAIQRRLSDSAGRIWVAFMILLLSGTSFTQVFFEYPEGLTYVAERLQKYRRTIITAEKIIAPNAIIIGDRADKVFFPERRVIVSDGRPVFSIPPALDAAVRLAEIMPVYFYTVERPSEEIQTMLKRNRFNLGTPVILPDGAFLYRLIRL